MPLPDDFWNDEPDPPPIPALEEESDPARARLIGFSAWGTVGVGYYNPRGITKLEIFREAKSDDAQDRNPSSSESSAD